MMRILFDSKSKAHKQPFGCIRQDELCMLTIHIPSAANAVKALIRLEGPDGYYQEISMQCTASVNSYDYYTGSFALQHCNLYEYFFRIVTENSEFLLFKEGSCQTTVGTSGRKWQLTCYDKHYDTPSHYKGGIMYQIFPDRFYQQESCDLSEKMKPFTVHEHKEDTPNYLPDAAGQIQNNDFYGGNLKGIKAKLPYLKDLHVATIYLNPICMAFSNHRYDTADYLRVDPMLGTMQDFIDLCAEAHKLGMKIILDGVFSHTGSDSVYFDIRNRFGNGAYHHPDSPYRPWYQFTNYPHQYESWWGIHTLPQVNKLERSYVDFILDADDSVVRYWLKVGADGFRLDVADELPDEFIQRLHQVVKEVKKDAIVIGEVWEDASNKVSYGVRRHYFTRAELDSVMNYPYKDAIIGFVRGDRTGAELADTVMTLAENYPKQILDCVMNSLSTHDTMRILTAVGVQDHNLPKEMKAKHRLTNQQLIDAIQKEMLAAFLQYTLPGSPCIYYGDEVGLEGFEDPFNRRFFPWEQVNEDLLAYYQELGWIKSSYHALATGHIEVIIEHPHVFGFTRTCDDSCLTIIANAGAELYEWKRAGEAVIYSRNCVCLSERILLDQYGFVLMA
ncbi:glycoside hydrolase family 13 protein [Paenibacillus albiflavus]|uniref:Glycoside hydrolase family 13 protein n=1 Tax=Paenibacillus albiflavus TaxID=2545760 RepID=A0A4R4EJ79_9BACL|nr:glycoside hydrolase family 13 protein [Paenibacillus albiflavus]TCZ78285.1 glycoside hydrolase family 13 protein [Paenibacillus albiflavus]